MALNKTTDTDKFEYNSFAVMRPRTEVKKKYLFLQNR